MDDTTLLKLVAALTGAFALVVGALVWLVKFSAKAIVSFISTQLLAMQKTISDHTTTDLEHHSEVKELVVRLEGKFDGIRDQLDRPTPVRGVPIQDEWAAETPDMRHQQPKKKPRTSPFGHPGYRHPTKPRGGSEGGGG